ncbi:MAG: single-stranded DNA-binding protein [Candidatus Pacebacteria bacterium]|nr:single-stranded DNA-binding protein [Candidatus Paceibacterota bacterium]
MYLNKALIIGNLTRDPELKALPSGIQVASISVATNRVWKDQNGAKQESTDYHNVVVFGRQAETAAQYLKKGSSVLVEGRMQTRSWDGQDGKKQYRTEVVADRIQFGNRPGDGASSSSGGAAGSKPSYGNSASSAPAKAASKSEDTDSFPSVDYPEEEINPEDIPF